MSSAIATAGFHSAALIPAARSRWAGRMRLMFDAIRTRRELAALDDRMLSDLGLSRADALHEAARAPWDLTSAR